MKRSFILYNEIEVGDDLVDCIYFLKDECWAQPFVSGEKGGYYAPTEEEQKKHCKNEANFHYCPRFTAYQNHLKAIGLKKEEHH